MVKTVTGDLWSFFSFGLRAGETRQRCEDATVATTMKNGREMNT